MDNCEVSRWAVLKSSLNNLSYAEFLERMKKDDQAVCLDARTAQEFATGSLPGAININYLSENLADELEQLDDQKQYFVYCRTSRRSLRICVLLRNMGFEQVYHLENGIADCLIE